MSEKADGAASAAFGRDLGRGTVQRQNKQSARKFQRAVKKAVQHEHDDDEPREDDDGKPASHS